MARRGLWLVDISLCLEAGASHLVNRADASGVLIAHYLETIDPQRRCSGARRRGIGRMLQRYSAVVTTSGFAQRALLAAGFPGPVEAIEPGLAAEYRQPVRRPVASRQPAVLTVASPRPQ